MTHDLSDAAICRHTLRWLEQAVIGLNLCPFAKGVHVKGQIHYVVSHSTDPADLLQDLTSELSALVDADPQARDTTLLIAPWCMPDFWEFNDFQNRANKALRKLGLEGVVQIASFHPEFQFAGTAPDDISNYTNRAPYPVLHLLREDSIGKAVEAFPAAEMIFEKNMQTLQSLGIAGWKALGLQPPDVRVAPPHGKIEP
jgi:hypothetical protein